MTIDRFDLLFQKKKCSIKSSFLKNFFFSKQLYTAFFDCHLRPYHTEFIINTIYLTIMPMFFLCVTYCDKPHNLIMV